MSLDFSPAQVITAIKAEPNRFSKMFPGYEKEYWFKFFAIALSSWEDEISYQTLVETSTNEGMSYYLHFCVGDMMPKLKELLDDEYITYQRRSEGEFFTLTQKALDIFNAFMSH